MDLEKLTKSQITLLTLLVSFVTSIATGIVTVSLVDQGPATITQSVSRIVRETVQNAVSPAITQTASIAAPIRADTPAPTLAQSISVADRSLVRLWSGTPDAPEFLGVGIVISESGTIVTDYDALGTLAGATVTLPNGSSTPMTVVMRDSSTDLAYLEPAASSSPHFVPARIAAAAPQVGDTVIALSGKSALRIASGLVVALSEKAPVLIDTNVAVGAFIKGSPLIDSHGDFLGISTGVSRASDPSAFMQLSAAAVHTAAAMNR